MYKKCKKIVAAMLVFIIILANLNSVGIHIGEVIAADLNNQNSKTKNSNVEIDTYLLIDEEHKAYEATKNIGEENKIITQIKVKNSGYLKDTKIKFENTNFSILNSINSEFVSSVNKEENEITLKQIQAEEPITLEIPIQFKNSETYNPEQFTLVNTAEISGIYVDSKGTQNKIEKETKLNINWVANSEALLEAQLTKVVPFSINENKGLIVQTTIKSGVKQNTMPIKDTQLQVKIPNIKNIPPKDIKVSANSMVATNGQENAIEFSSENYIIEDGMITIKTQNNKDESQNISWKKQGVDEYVITYIYGQEVLEAEQIDIELKVNSDITLYDTKQTNLTANYEETIKINEKIGNIVDFAINTTENISKGQIYANYISNEKQEIIYNEKLTANIGLASLIDEIIIKQNEDKFIAEGIQAPTTYENKNYTYYKNISISNQNFNKILGEEGFIKIYSQETQIATIDKNTQVNEKQNYEIDLTQFNINEIAIYTSKPQIEGKLEIDITKAIKTEIDYNKEQISKFENLKIQSQIQANSNNEKLLEQEISAEVKLVEPKTKIDIQTNTTNLSTIVKNENIELRLVLDTSSNYNKLFKNPKIILELPAYVEQMDIKNIQLLYDEELVKQSYEYKVAENNSKILEIVLKGTQTKYSFDEITRGANIIITADITTNNLTPTIASQIKMSVINEGETTQANLPINFIAPVRNRNFKQDFKPYTSQRSKSINK